jgi:hypothetical protein
VFFVRSRTQVTSATRRATTDGGYDAILEFLLGRDADVAQDGAGEF